MQVRSVVVGLSVGALAVPIAAWAQSGGSGSTGTTGATGATGPSSTDTGATFFRTAIMKDAKTTGAVKNLLDSKAGFIDPATAYGDLTGDGKPDAIVRVDTAGAAGAIAVYVLTVEGSKTNRLHVVYRNQQLYRVTSKFANSLLTLTHPVWAKGDDVCCPSQLRSQDYKWDPKARTLIRAGASRTAAAPTPSATGPTGPAGTAGRR